MGGTSLAIWLIYSTSSWSKASLKSFRIPYVYIYSKKHVYNLYIVCHKLSLVTISSMTLSCTRRTRILIAYRQGQYECTVYMYSS